MTRPRRRTNDPARRVPAHAILLEIELATWAGEPIAHTGRRDALLGRVEALRLSLDGRAVESRVRGNRPLPYTVTVRVGADGLEAVCSCSGAARRPCRHAVAALETLRFPLSRPARQGRPIGRRTGAGRGRIIQRAPVTPGFVIVGAEERMPTREERVASARREELRTSRQHARRERARVEPILTPDAAPRYAVFPRGEKPRQMVTLRGAEPGKLTCTCEEFAVNELHTCRHVERVSSWRLRQKKSKRGARPERLLSLWWSPRVSIDRAPVPLREIRVDAPHGARPRAFERYFDEEGWLHPEPEGRDGASWARAARDAARRIARREGFDWDLDPAVATVIREAAVRETLDARRVVDPGGTIWNEVVSRIRFRLHPYQEEGSRFLARAGRAFLADDMGLGKTLQAIVATLILRRTAAVRKTLVVCPASLKHQWSREIERACGETSTVVDGPRAGRLRLYRRWPEGFLILNYELVLRDLDAIRGAGVDLVILDEAQRIKNWDTKTARAVKKLDSPHAFVLTGTPLENRLIELHSLVEFLHMRTAGPRWRLLPLHAVTDARGRIVAYEGLNLLRERLRRIFLRRERADVQHQLPERTDNTFWTGMTTIQLRPYRKHAAAAAALLAEKRPLLPQETRMLLRALTAMRILCNAHAQYDWANHEARLRSESASESFDLRALHSPKLEEFSRVMEDLLEESERKIVVFSQWKRMLLLAHHAVRGWLESHDLRAEVFHGGLDGRARSAMLDAFRIDPEFRVLFSTDAGGLGLNLQDAASIVVNLEVPWNPAVLEQRVGRVHRMGQPQSVQVLHFVTRGAIEERVRRVVEEKRALFDGLLVDGADEIVLDERNRASFLERARSLIGDDV